ncbi:MAG: hypothetical protein LUH20_05475 [Lachnospiraceae bacterium]|nr:hypothetical protein [Lachnospiraceae bacterium]
MNHKKGRKKIRFVWSPAQRLMSILCACVLFISGVLHVDFGRDVAYASEPVLVCALEEHTHSDSCYEMLLTCERTEHTHSADCYDADGNLICGREEHVHDDSCYTTARWSAARKSIHTAQIVILPWRHRRKRSRRRRRKLPLRLPQRPELRRQRRRQMRQRRRGQELLRQIPGQKMLRMRATKRKAAVP